MTIAIFSVNNRVFANLLLMVMLLGGAATYLSMPREVFPAIPLDMVMITTAYVGAPPEEVEKQVTIPIENVIEGIENVESVSSQSYENISMIEIKVQQGTEDLQKLVSDIKDAIERITNYPSDADDPRVILIESQIPVISVAVSGDVPEGVRRKASEAVKSRIMGISGVSGIQETGLREREMWVELDPYRISAIGISPRQVVTALRLANVNIPSGVLTGSRQEFPLRTTAELKTAGDIEKVVVMRDRAGREIRIKDIATVTDRFEEPVSIGRLDGEESVSLLVMKSKTGSSIEIVDQVREMVEEYRKVAPRGISLKLTQDTSRFIKQRLRTLYVSGSIGLTLVCFVLFLFLNWRMAFWTAIGIPASFMGAILMMENFGITINMMSLFALILVLGMVVDDAIIVTENVYRYVQAGYSPKKAAIMGTAEVFWPIAAATATTIAAFLPMLLMSGIMGKFISTIPIVVTLCLLASFVEAFVILPSHLADYAKPANKAIEPESEWFKKVRKIYRNTIKFLLKERYKALAVSLLMFIFSMVYAANYMKFVLFNAKDIMGFVVGIELPEGSSLRQTADALRGVEEIAKGLPKEDIKAAVSMVGMTINYHNGRVSFGSNLAQTYFESTEFDTEGRRNGYEVLEETREKLKLLTGLRSIDIQAQGGGPPIGSALEARISGEDYPVLTELTEKLEKYLKSVKGVVDVKNNYSPGKSELHIVPDRDKLSLFGLTENDISNTVKSAFDGTIAGTIKRGSDDIDIRVLFDAEHRESIDFIPQLSIIGPSGKQVRLSTVAEIKWERGLSTVNHFNRQRTIKVFANVDTGQITSSELSRKVSGFFEGVLPGYPGYSITFGGETEEQIKSIQSLLRATMIGLMAIYLILGTLFKSFLQPLVVISAIPFSFIGVIVGHKIMGEPIGMLSLIGFAALTGIVVNDSLVMVDFINNARRRGASRWLSILRSAFVRFRPVILTSLTTILGLSTIAFKTTGQAAFLAPMAISIVFGLIFSTVLTLIVIPCLYAVLDDLNIRIGGEESLLMRESEA